MKVQYVNSTKTVSTQIEVLKGSKISGPQGQGRKSSMQSRSLFTKAELQA